MSQDACEQSAVKGALGKQHLCPDLCVHRVSAHCLTSCSCSSSTLTKKLNLNRLASVYLYLTNLDVSCVPGGVNFHCLAGDGGANYEKGTARCLGGIKRIGWVLAHLRFATGQRVGP